MNSLDYVVEKVLSVIRKDITKKTTGYDAIGIVRRIDGNTVWVHFDNGADETPVNKSINCAKGDKVRVRVSNGSAFIVGNDSAPPTDDTKAEHAQITAEISEQTAEEAQTTASEAQSTAEAADTKADTALEQVGASITTDTLHYLATDQSSGVTTSTPGWTTTVQAITSSLSYLWTYHTYHKASGQSVNTQPVITGVYGDTGATGPAGPTGPQGQAGNDGDDGVSVTMVQPYYCLSASDNQLAGTETWGTAIPTPTSALPYIWTKDLVTFSDSTTSYSTAVYNEALTHAVSTAESALNIAEGIDEHFWYDNTGAHVTEDTQEDYQQDPSSAGGNTLITSQGMAIRKGTTELASFGSSGAQIGQNASGMSRAVISGGGMQINRNVNGTDAQIVNLGYGPGTDSGGGTSDAPYYTLGTRLSGSTVGNYSVAEGYETTADGSYSHAEGWDTTASSICSHAEGSDTTASGFSSHAEGQSTTASGNYSHAEGWHTTAIGRCSHAEGLSTTASGFYSHAAGFGTTAAYERQTVIGEYNDNKSANAFEIGNGTGQGNTPNSNAFEVDWYGNVNIPSGAEYKINGTSILDLIYPVGSIYMSVNSTDPSTLMAGTTWQRITGKFLLAATDGGSSGASQAAGNTGGAATVTLTAAQSGLRSHSHGAGTNQAFIRYNYGTVSSGVGERSVASGASGNYKAPVVNNASVDFSYAQSTSSEGGDDATSAHNNMPPYLSVYVWKRTA